MATLTEEAGTQAQFVYPCDSLMEMTQRAHWR